MSTEAIKDHFSQYLGVDVAVTFSEPDDPRSIVLFRPDRLSDRFVSQAFEALARSTLELAGQIERLAVSFDTRLGRTRRRVPLPNMKVPSGIEL